MAKVEIPAVLDAPHRRCLVGGEPMIFHCHHYNVFLQRSILDAINLRDVGMIQRSQHLRFALEPGQPLLILRQRSRQNFDRHFAIELGVGSAKHFAHASLAKLGSERVMRNGSVLLHG